MKEIVRMVSGSHLYGTFTPDSDIDIKGVYIPSGKDILFQQARGTLGASHLSDVSPQDDIEVFSLQRYLKQVCEGQTVALDMLFTPEHLYLKKPKPEWQEILQNRRAFLSQETSAMVGFARKQATKYCLKADRLTAVQDILVQLQVIRDKSPQARLSDFEHKFRYWSASREFINLVDIDVRGTPVAHLEVCGRKVPLASTAKQAIGVYEALEQRYGERTKQAQEMGGKDWKALMHAVRIVEETKELLLTHQLTFPRPEASHLMDIRLGELPLEKVLEEIDRGIEEIDSLKKKSTLPEKPDFKRAESLVEAYYRKQVEQLKPR